MVARRTTLAVLAALAVVSGACKGESGKNDSTTTASLLRLTTVVEQAAIGTDFAPAQNHASVVPGDRLRTDASGHAEIDWPDGSLARLGPTTQLTVTSLTEPAKNRVKLKLDVGETWHHVKKITGTGAYEVETSVGTAAVRGTEFAIACTADEQCSFRVVDGTITLTRSGSAPIEINAGQRLTASPDLPLPQPEVVGVDVLRTEPFIADNLRLDALAPAERASAVTAETTTSTTIAQTTTSAAAPVPTTTTAGFHYSFTPTSGPVGTVVHVTGGGCPHTDAPFDVAWGIATGTSSQSFFPSNADGTFAFDYLVDAGHGDTPPGPYPTSAICRATDEQLETGTFTVTG